MNRDSSFANEKINPDFLKNFTKIFMTKKMKLKTMTDKSLEPGKKYYMFHTATLLDYLDRDQETIANNLKDEPNIFNVWYAKKRASDFVGIPNMNMVWSNKAPQYGDLVALISRFEPYGLSATYVGEQKVMSSHEKNARLFPSEHEWNNMHHSVKKQLLTIIGIEDVSDLTYPEKRLKELQSPNSEADIFRAFKNMKLEFGDLTHMYHFDSNALVYEESKTELEEGKLDRNFINLVSEYGISSRYEGFGQLEDALNPLKNPNGIDELVYFNKESIGDYPTILIDYDDDNDDNDDGNPTKKQKRGGKKKRRSQRVRKTKNRTKRKN